MGVELGVVDPIWAAFCSSSVADIAAAMDDDVVKDGLLLSL